jgi:ATP-dependent RNA helicase DeaD
MPRHSDLPKAFADLGLDIPILRAVRAMDYTEPSPIQRELVPLVLAGKDVLGQARTGTGKTAAFGMPCMQAIVPDRRLQMIVLTPTRELAAQVLGEFRRLSQFMEIRCVPVYGGTRMRQQLHQLGKRPHIVVGTPGRVIDMIGRRALHLDEIRFAVLDEVDRMLDIGFRDDIKRILGEIRHEHQTILVSATIDDEIKQLSRKFMRDPIEVNVSRDQLTVSEVSQHYCTVPPWDKFRLLKMLLKKEEPRLAIVFCNTKHSVRKLAKRLHAAGVNAREIHGDLIQQKREKVMTRFRQQRISVLVATDLAARGVDVRRISHIINYDLPQEIQVYVHRIGRTARMGETGMAISFVAPDEGVRLTEVEKLINKEIQPLIVDGFEPSPPPREEAAPKEPEVPDVFRPMQAGAATNGATATRPVGPSLGGKFPVRRKLRRR